VIYAFKPVTRCDMCGSGNHRLLGLRLNVTQGIRPGRAEGITVSVKQCRDCDLIFANPQPIPADISDHYGVPPEEYWRAHPEWTPAYLSRQIATAQRLLPFMPGMTALDIGAGLGMGMRSLTFAGFDTWGLEPSEPFFEKAKQNVDPARLALSTVEEADYPPASFDFITFGAVLEHLYSPRAALDRAFHWLKPGGIIHAEVPSSRWLVSKLVNAYYRLCMTNLVTNLSPMHSPYHLYEFGLRSFKRYEVARHEIEVCSIPHFPLKPVLRWIMGRTGTGMQLTVYLTSASKRALELSTKAMDLLDAHGSDPKAAAYLALAQQQLRTSIGEPDSEQNAP
jgi:2-polyprenyl-3-methyl-5-hydroxy-6-metoxy-1,4-benzoquinol methylase